MSERNLLRMLDEPLPEPEDPHKVYWRGTLSRGHRMALLHLEEAAGEHADGSGTPLADFASKVYEVLHYISAPDCRKNHPTWNPVSVGSLGSESAGKE